MYVCRKRNEIIKNIYHKQKKGKIVKSINSTLLSYNHVQNLTKAYLGNNLYSCGNPKPFVIPPKDKRIVFDGIGYR